MKKADRNVVIPPLYQKIFIGAMVLVWLVQVAVMLLASLGHNGIPVSALWLYQLSSWGMPALFFLLALASFGRRYKGQQLLFWTVFLATIGDMVYMGLQSLEEGTLQFYLRNNSAALNGSLWTGRAGVWLVMAFGTVLFVLGLVYMQKRKV